MEHPRPPHVEERGLIGARMMKTSSNHFNSQQKFAMDAEKACVRHLVDLMREYGGGTLGEAKDAYRQRCELDVEPAPRTVFANSSPYFVERSYVGSQFADAG